MPFIVVQRDNQMTVCSVHPFRRIPAFNAGSRLPIDSASPAFHLDLKMEVCGDNSQHGLLTDN